MGNGGVGNGEVGNGYVGNGDMGNGDMGNGDVGGLDPNSVPKVWLYGPEWECCSTWKIYKGATILLQRIKNHTMSLPCPVVVSLYIRLAFYSCRSRDNGLTL